jgi:hypothetical protein
MQFPRKERPGRIVGISALHEVRTQTARKAQM